jgi:hypothetical protein
MSLKRWDGTQWVIVAGSRPGAQGPQGATGPAGASATIAIGTVTALAAGQNPTVTNSGTSSAAVLNFSIPAGAAGSTGAQGQQGVAGQRGSYTFTGIANPTSGNPASKNGLDTYLNTTSGDYFQYDSAGSAWVLQGNLKGPVGPTGATGATGSTGPSGNELANQILASTTAYQIDALFNLGIYYPKYQTTLSQSQLNSKFAASSFLF